MILTDDAKSLLVMEHIGPTALAHGTMSIYDAFMLALEVGEKATIAAIREREPAVWRWGVPRLAHNSFEWRYSLSKTNERAIPFYSLENVE
jgi:hypothetical protein